ncbi:hypothetical protein HDU97_009434 [Phlyctochytrium planicorne]|nr:hypothetical protein HDU97_009434 [Phlyctochytrium planicorne]
MVKDVGRLSMLPEELFSEVLKLTGDWKIALSIEAIKARLPHHYQDALQAMEAVQAQLGDTFPSSLHLINQLDYDSFRKLVHPRDPNRLTNLNLLQVAFALKAVDAINVPRLASLNPQSLKFLRYLHSKDSFAFESYELVSNAALDGCLETIKFLHSIDSWGFTCQTMESAAFSGHLDIVRWLHENRREGATVEALESAVAGRHFEIVKWLTETLGIQCNQFAFDGAARTGSLDILKWLHANTQTPAFDIGNTVESAMREGHLEAAKWLVETYHYSMEDEKLVEVAAGYGHLDMVKWVLKVRDQQGFQDPFGDGAIFAAATNGHLAVLKFLNEKRPQRPADFAPFDGVAGRGHLEIVKWIHEAWQGGFTHKAMDKC